MCVEVYVYTFNLGLETSIFNLENDQLYLNYILKLFYFIFKLKEIDK